MGQQLKRQGIPKILLHSLNHAGARAFLPEQEATSLETEEYNDIVLSVGNAVDPNKNLSSKRKRGNYNLYSQNCMQKSLNKGAKTENHFKVQLPIFTESTVRTFKQAY